MKTSPLRRAAARLTALLLSLGLAAGVGLVTAAPASAVETTGTIAGTIVGQGDPVVPLTGPAQVTAYPVGSTSSSGIAGVIAGAFTLAGLEEGEYRIAVRQFGSSAWANVPTVAGFFPTLEDLATLPIVQVAAGSTTTTEIVLPRLGSIAGTVTSAVDGSPVVGASVSVSSTTDGRGGFATTDASGAYVVERLAPGTYSVTASAEGGLVYLSGGGTFVLSNGAAVTGVDVVLGPGATISGVLRLDDGSPAAGVLVSIHSPNGFTVNLTGSAADGSYEFRALPAGDYRLAFGAFNDTPGETNGDFVEEWYSDAADFDSAAVITIGNGAVLTGYDAEVALLAEVIVPGAVSIIGNATPGETLTVDYGTWTPQLQSRRNEWLRDGILIDGAQYGWYTVTEADLGSRISLRVTGSGSGVRSATALSEPTDIVQQRMTTATPTIVGTVEVGRRIAVQPGVWTPDRVKFSYQWFRWGTPISGATSRSYTLTDQDAGKSLTVRVTGSKVGWGPTSVESVWTGPVPPVPVVVAGTVEVAGVERVGRRLAARIEGWGPDGVRFTYQWSRNGAPIDGATARAYVLTADDEGAEITVVATGAWRGYNPVSVTATAGPIGPASIR